MGDSPRLSEPAGVHLTSLYFPRPVAAGRWERLGACERLRGSVAGFGGLYGEQLREASRAVGASARLPGCADERTAATAFSSLFGFPLVRVRKKGS